MQVVASCKSVSVRAFNALALININYVD